MTDIVRDMVQTVAAGVRRMNNPPDAFLYTKDDEFCFDQEKICGFPVYHTALVMNNMTEDEVPFIPLWKEDGDYITDRARFNKAYLEYKE